MSNRQTFLLAKMVLIDFRGGYTHCSVDAENHDTARGDLQGSERIISGSYENQSASIEAESLYPRIFLIILVIIIQIIINAPMSCSSL
jgi:hypothetical protein